MREVRIAGGGPAGLTLGILLRRRGVPVRVFEAGTYPRHKICGEFLAPRHPRLLETAGLARAVGECPRAVSVEWFTGPRPRGPARFDLPHPARIVTRLHFDAALRDLLLESGGEVETGVRVEGENSGVEGMVCAAGRKKAPGPCRWVGLKAHFEGLAPRAGLEMHTGDGAYVGICGIGPGRVNVSGLFRAAKIPGGSARDWTALLENHRLGGLARRLAGTRMVPGSLCAVSHLGFGWAPGGNGLAVGDALAVIPPLAGNGLSLAVESAMLAAPPLEAWAGGKISWEAAVSTARRACLGRMARRLKLAGTAQSLLLSGPCRAIFSWLAAAGAVPWRRLFLLLGT